MIKRIIDAIKALIKRILGIPDQIVQDVQEIKDEK